jgi:hypothetical protein
MTDPDVRVCSLRPALGSMSLLVVFGLLFAATAESVRLFADLHRGGQRVAVASAGIARAVRLLAHRPQVRPARTAARVDRRCPAAPAVAREPAGAPVRLPQWSRHELLDLPPPTL